MGRAGANLGLRDDSAVNVLPTRGSELAKALP
jgi:hypothetical protein